VDLDGFEPSTSSMPFKKYQLVADILTKNKRLSKNSFEGWHARIRPGERPKSAASYSNSALCFRNDPYLGTFARSGGAEILESAG